MTVAATSVAEAEELPAAPTSTPYEFDDSLQAKLLNLMLRDYQFAQRTAGLIKPEYFTDETNAALAGVANDHFAEFREPVGGAAVLLEVLKDAVAKRRVPKNLIPEINARMKPTGALRQPLADREFLMKRAVEFAKHRAMENAILESAEAHSKGDYDKIEKLFKEAMQVGVNKTVASYDYYQEIKTRTQYRKDVAAGIIKKNGITTGCADFDKRLYHGGFGRKEMVIVMAAPKGGKSGLLGEFGKAASLDGKNVLYVTLEVAAVIIAERLDAALADMAIALVGQNPFKVQAAIELAEKGSGKLIIEEYPSGVMKVSDLRKLLDEHRARGLTFDMIIVDYGDLMRPENSKTERREGLGEIFTELRGIAFEENAALLTATQTNREGAKHTIAKATDVAEDWSKIMVADLVLSINATDEEKLLDEMRIHFAASRNSPAETITVKTNRSRMQFLKSVLGTASGGI